MAQVPLERQFAGQARLVRLLLWRVGDSTDVDGCLRVAVESAMLTADDAAFLRECLEAEERQRAHGAAPGVASASIASAGASAAGAVREAGSAAEGGVGPGLRAAAPAEGLAGLAVDEGVVSRMRRCADKLNRADAA